MSKPVFELLISPNSASSRVICNGEDISHKIRGVEIRQIAGCLPRVKLDIIITDMSIRYQGEADQVLGRVYQSDDDEKFENQDPSAKK